MGDNHVMREQLQRLLEISERENVNLQVLTLDAKHPINTGAFILLEFGDILAKLYPDVGYVEHLTGTLYFEEERDTHQYHLAFRRLSDYAADQAHSRRMISKAMAKWA